MFSEAQPDQPMPIQRLILVGFLFATLTLSSCAAQKTDKPAASPTATTNAAPNASYETSTSPAVAAENNTAQQTAQQFANLPRLNGKATVVLTVKGKPIAIEIDGTNAPITAGNFIELVQKGFYNNLTFHRVEPEFVVQGGDPRGNGTGGYVPKGQAQERRIPLEIKVKGAAAPTYSQVFDVTQPPELPHKRGAIAMARSPMPDSASSQFYITLAQQDFLDGKYAVFGKVISGMEVIDTIKVGDKISSAKVTKGAAGLKLPK